MMNKRGTIALYLFMLFVVFVILGITLSKPLTDNANENKNQLGKTLAYNETYNLDSCLVNGSEFLQVNTSNPSCNLTVINNEGTLTESCPLTGVVVRNLTNNTLVSNTDYILNASGGTIALQNTSSFNYNLSGNLTYIDYTFCPLGYVNCSTGDYQDKALCGQLDTFPFFYVALTFGLGATILRVLGK